MPSSRQSRASDAQAPFRHRGIGAIRLRGWPPARDCDAHASSAARIPLCPGRAERSGDGGTATAGRSGFRHAFHPGSRQFADPGGSPRPHRSGPRRCRSSRRRAPAVDWCERLGHGPTDQSCAIRRLAAARCRYRLRTCELCGQPHGSLGPGYIRSPSCAGARCACPAGCRRCIVARGPQCLAIGNRCECDRLAHAGCATGGDRRGYRGGRGHRAPCRRSRTRRHCAGIRSCAGTKRRRRIAQPPGRAGD